MGEEMEKERGEREEKEGKMEREEMGVGRKN